MLVVEFVVFNITNITINGKMSRKFTLYRNNGWKCLKNTYFNRKWKFKWTFDVKIFDSRTLVPGNIDLVEICVISKSCNLS